MTAVLLFKIRKVKILLYTFYKRWGLCSRVVWELTETTPIPSESPLLIKEGKIEKYHVNGFHGVSGLLKKIENGGYDFVIGLGDYRKDAKRIRIETKFVNKYGKNKILKHGKDCYNADGKYLKEIVGENKPHPNPLLKSPLSLRDISPFTKGNLGEGTSKGPCNRSAYLISELIERKGLKTKLLFLHVPRSLEINRVREVIQNVIKSTDIPQ